MTVVLSDRQRSIVNAQQPSLTVRGLPGTGKTTALAWRFVREVDRIAPRRILVLTRNFATATAMVAQLREIVPGPLPSRGLSVLTFRSLARQEVQACYSVLGWETPPAILDADVDWDLKRRALLAESDEEQWPQYSSQLTEAWFRKEVFDRAMRVSENGLDREDLEIRALFLPDNLGWPEVDRFLRNLHACLRADGVLAQSDVLSAFGELMSAPHVVADWRQQYRVLLVDDAEDNLPLENDFIELLTGDDWEGRMVVAGNPFGSARLSAGAEPSWFDKISRQVPAVNLDRNYAVGEPIGSGALRVLPASVPPQQWNGHLACLTVLRVATTYEEMLEQVADVVASELEASSKAAPLAVVVPDMNDAVALRRLQRLLSSRDVRHTTLYGSRRVVDDPYARAAFTVCQLTWPTTFGAPEACDVAAMLTRLVCCRPDLLIPFHSWAGNGTVQLEELVDWCSSVGPSGRGLDVLCSALTEVSQSTESPAGLVATACTRVALPALDTVTVDLDERDAARKAIEDLVDAASRYEAQMEDMELVDRAGKAFADALDDPGFAPLSQEDGSIPDSVVLTYPMKLLELGWRLHGLVLVDLVDSVWVRQERSPLSDARLLSRHWNGETITPSGERESAVADTCNTLARLMLQARDVVYVTASALRQAGEPTKGFRLYSSLLQASAGNSSARETSRCAEE